jgi:hypothetical protein
MFLKIFPLLFCLSLTAFGQTNPREGVVTKSLFKKGSFWIWNYYENGELEKLYSQEKYTVTKRERNYITFVLSSKIGEETEFSKRFKFKVNLKTCQNKYRQRHFNPSYSLLFWQRQNKKWTSLGRTGKSLLFEEKFNCNQFLSEKRQTFDHPLRGLIETTGTTKEGSFYFKEGSLEGVLSHKHFNRGTAHYYLMLLAHP